MKPKVLVAAPVYEGARKVIHEFITACKNLDYENFDILLVDNSKEDDFYDYLKSKEWDKISIIRDDSNEEFSMTRLVHSRNLIIKEAREGEYDYLLMLDSDVIVPPDIINRLIKDEKDIVGGVYYNFFNIQGTMKWMPVAFKFLTMREKEEMKNLGFKLDIDSKITRWISEEEIKSGDLLEIDFAQSGCLMLSRKAFGSLDYGKSGDYLDSSKSKIIIDECSVIMNNARDKGFKSYLDTKLICRHEIEYKGGQSWENKDYKFQ